MLKQRLLTAIILIPIFILLVLTLSAPWFCALTGGLLLLGAWEWSFFMGINTFPQNLFYPGIIAMLLFTSLALPIPSVLLIAFIWWLIAAILVIRYPRASQAWSKGIVLRGLMGIVVLIPCWLAVNFIRNATHGTYILLFLFVLIWGADAGAYFVGKKWGKTKLAPSVSPGKTWEGLYGALVTTFIITVGSLFLLKMPHSSWLFWLSAIALALITVLFSVVGDLFESMLKRNVGLKDSGRIFPGHGGLLDRIDSLTAAAPIFALGAMLLWEIFH